MAVAKKVTMLKVNLIMKTGNEHRYETEESYNVLIAKKKKPQLVWHIDIGDNRMLICSSEDISEIIYLKGD